MKYTLRKSINEKLKGHYSPFLYDTIDELLSVEYPFRPRFPFNDEIYAIRELAKFKWCGFDVDVVFNCRPQYLPVIYEGVRKAISLYGRRWLSDGGIEREKLPNFVMREAKEAANNGKMYEFSEFRNMHNVKDTNNISSQYMSYIDHVIYIVFHQTDTFGCLPIIETHTDKTVFNDNELNVTPRSSDTRSDNIVIINQ